MPNFQSMQPGYYDPSTGQFYAAPTQQGQFSQPSYSPATQMQQPTQGYMQPQMPSYQPPQQQNQSQFQESRQGLKGRIVNDIAEVKPNEIPMDGSFCYFPTRDGKKVYVKVWDDDAVLRTFCFIPEEPIIEAKKNEEKTQYETILSRFDDLEAAITSKTCACESKKKG